MSSTGNLIMAVVLIVPSLAGLREPACSQFHFQEKLLEKSVRYEHKLEVYEQKLNSWEEIIQKKITELDAAETARIEEVKRTTNLYQQNVHDMNQKLEQTIGKLQRKSEEIKTKLQEKENKINLSLEESLRKYDSQLKAVTEAYQTPTVMFAAKQFSDADIADGKVIKFPEVINNIGHGYDTSTGEFTAPYNGSYMFHASVCSYEDKWVLVHMVAGKTVIGSTGVYNSAASGSCSSTSGLAILKKGETVWVEGSYTHKGAGYSGSIYRWPTFSGMLVHMDK